ncbi:ww domain containing protein [Sporothrix brasiliensis 5110]|uniref:Ww domain containing protein n=1 Tax=Sporothrix brasiliensis 5110 TaxID=1398154 RepID=A0A0C2F0B0_9PEZI|nr:ww domain containing protein [Sporothrix brasiliensis 5110]KIH92229.1 ww domain containing protein [Sporothrix brasiliensis 5110]
MPSSPDTRPADEAETAPSAAEHEVKISEEAVEETDVPEAEAKIEEEDPTQATGGQKDEPTRESTTGAEAQEKTEVKTDDTDKEIHGPSISTDTTTAADASVSPPPLPDEPLPDEAVDENDDGWDPMWSGEHQAWYFVNRFTQQTQWENPRVPDAQGPGASGGGARGGVGGYNPVIHGDYDPNAWYATGEAAPADADAYAGADVDGGDPIAAAAAAAAAVIQDSAGAAGSRFSHGSKASRQLNNYFDVAAANSAHDGRSLKAERSGIKPSKSELKAFKEKRRARKEEKRRAWLRD